ncbi:GNAT family N-acetyltransferase [Streptomyces sp. ADI98-10]|uniref:GNAT family N-acetyltransferase n=1 Tax=Streptomyces sp. ADI98-10 TaxID=1522763 RepID=UPI000F54F4A7|nr:GNAT family N-acetyltransferase [Streptomyces sp. ADI98-10]RPK92405.1 putative acetyltransferase [Streptomyces sp. ADI98-10]
MDPTKLSMRQCLSPADVTPDLRRCLTSCWVEVTNAGGAAGFPFPPVDAEEVAPSLDLIVDQLAPGTSRLVTAHVEGHLVGWLHLRREPSALTGHWGSVHHVQSDPRFRRRGIGAALMNEARRIAREEMGLRQLHLAARGGAGLEHFYERLGWKEVGRGPAALRLTGDDYRDEVLMLLAPL